MVVTTKSDVTWGYSLEFDDQLLIRNAQIPDHLPIQMPSGSTFVITREPLDILSRRRYTLANADRETLAVLSGRIGWSALKVGDVIYRVRLKPISGLTFAIGRQSYLVNGMGIDFEIREHFLSCEIVSTTSTTDDQKLALIALLHFAWLHKWRES